MSWYYSYGNNILAIFTKEFVTSDSEDLGYHLSAEDARIVITKPPVTVT